MFVVQAPAVVFIDELDAVGRQRGLIGGSGGQERDATLNQVLNSLNLFQKDSLQSRVLVWFALCLCHIF